MAKLYEKHEMITPYEVYPGKNIEQMPMLIKDGRVPIIPGGVLRRRLEVLGEGFSDDVRKEWWHNYSDTGMGVARHSDGSVKFVPNAKQMRELNLKSTLKGNLLVLGDDVYESLKGLKLTSKQIRKEIKGEYSPEEIPENMVWLYFDNDASFLREYVKETLAFAKANKLDYNKLMGLYLPSVDEEVARMGLVCVGGLEFGSDADGRFNLGYDGRLVGVPENAAEGGAQKTSATQEGLENLIGKGVRVGNVVVIEKDKIPSKIYALLTQKQ